MSTIVYVVNQNGNPLMPCKPSKARKLLRDGRAKACRHNPFTIQLDWDCEEHVQEVTVGIDKGSHVTGISCVGKGEILLSGEIHHRKDVKEKMDGRRAHRRSRRNRNTTLTRSVLPRISRVQLFPGQKSGSTRSRFVHATPAGSTMIYLELVRGG